MEMWGPGKGQGGKKRDMGWDGDKELGVAKGKARESTLLEVPGQQEVQSGHHLTLEECWRALEKSKEKGGSRNGVGHRKADRGK